jgi:hypothetical protein
MSTARPPRKYRITTIGPPPQWAAEWWYRRQLEIRGRIRSMIQAQRGGGAPELWMSWQLRPQFDRQETMHAISEMIADAALVLVDDLYYLPFEEDG